MGYPLCTAEDKQEPEPTQETPQGHKIPVPTRKQVFRDLQKVAKPSSERDRRRPQKERQDHRLSVVAVVVAPRVLVPSRE